ncbi:MAG TPA: hypothetical protein VFS25_23365, partial [Chitinophaga sp.]|uniref:hypothetical protein n=1 Tax=Chitinophaga sp. TaxID=1869181 RepID=UPI002DB763C7
QDYTNLKLQFDSLYRVSISSLDRTSRDIGIVKDSLSNVSTQLNNTNIIIGDAIHQVNQARKRSFLDKLYWGIGGLGIGVAITAVVAAIN